MKIRVVAVGRDARDPICRSAADYLERLCHYVPAELVEVKEEPLRGGSSVARVRRAEAERIRKVFRPGDHLVALDERGIELSSMELAERLERWGRTGVQSIGFVIGGPSGLDPELVAAADERWSLSKMTLPHRFARLILLEQLYRACTIRRNEPYHK